MIIEPSNEKKVHCNKFFYKDSVNFLNGNKKQENLACIISKFLHASEYCYIDDRKANYEENKINIYLHIKTDLLCESCQKANLKNREKDKYRKSHSFVRLEDCTCGWFVNVRSYINALTELLEDSIFS